MSESDSTNATRGLAERYRVLLDIGRKLARTLSPEELYRAIYAETSRVLETTGFYVALYDRDADEYYCLRCSFTGDEQEVLRLNAQFRAKYRDRTKRITDF